MAARKIHLYEEVAMKPAKDTAKVEKMFARGEPFLVDPASGYKYSMVARCPKDGTYASVAQIEKEGHTLSRVVFMCPKCFDLFEGKAEDISVF
jgi:hypothetical protein